MIHFQSSVQNTSYEYFTIKSSSSGPDQPGHAQVLRQEEHWTAQHQEQDHGLSPHCHGSDKKILSKTILLSFVNIN